MNSIFLATHLDKLGNEVSVYYSEQVEQRPIFSLLFKTYATLLDNNRATSKFYWNRLPDAKVVWAEDSTKKILSAILFEFQPETRSAYILTTLTDPTAGNRGINKICFRYYVQKAKENNMVRTAGLASVNNDDVVKKNAQGNNVSWGGGKPLWIIFTDRL
jgi:hypothetical protein